MARCHTSLVRCQRPVRCFEKLPPVFFNTLLARLFRWVSFNVRWKTAWKQNLSSWRITERIGFRTNVIVKHVICVAISCLFGPSGNTGVGMKSTSTAFQVGKKSTTVAWLSLVFLARTAVPFLDHWHKTANCLAVCLLSVRREDQQSSILLQGSPEIWVFFFFFTQRTQISIFTSVQGVLDPAAYYESYFPPNVLYLCLKVHVYNSVIMCSVRHMSKKNTLAICFSSAISKLLRNLLFRKQINIYCFTIFGHIWWGRHHRQCSCWI